MALSTVTLQQVVNFASTNAELQSLSGVGGYSNEPALSIANEVMTELLASPHNWKFNRADMNLLVLCPNKQDYQFAGATIFSLGSTAHGAAVALKSGNGITFSGSTVTVNTIEDHGFAVGDVVYMYGNADSVYNSVFTETPLTGSSAWSNSWTVATVPTSKSLTFAANAAQVSAAITPSGASGITDFEWLASGTLVDMNSTACPRDVKQIEAVFELSNSSRTNVRPLKVAVMHDDGSGTLTLRFHFVPGYPYGFQGVYQKKAVIKTALADTWSTFPDTFRFVYQQMFVALALRNCNSAKYPMEYEKAMQKIVKALVKADSEADDIRIYPEESLINTDFGYWAL